MNNKTFCLSNTFIQLMFYLKEEKNITGVGNGDAAD